MSKIVMQGKDAVSAKLAECFITVGNNRYNFMQAIDFEAKFERVKSKIPILGQPGAGNKSTSWRGTGKATFHYNSAVFRDMMLKFKNTGNDVYFEIQVTNHDPASSSGKQTIVFVDCNIDGGILAKFDANGEYLDERLDFTFEDFRIPQRFNRLSGM